MCIRDRDYDIQRIDGLPEQMVTPLDDEIIERIIYENDLIKEKKKINLDLTYFKDSFIQPTEGIISGVFGSQRILNGKAKSPHRGLDIAAETGTPIYACNEGLVIHAEDDLYYTGGTIILDHGHGVKSIYAHLSDVKVAVSQMVSKDDIKHKFLKDRHEIKHKEIPSNPCIGTINGLWANALGKGGIIPIETKWFYSNTFLDFKLTGMQGDVMQESMGVAKTLATSLTTNTKMKSLMNSVKTNKLQGIHIHCPEGAVPKDGPSAGTAITVALYSLINKKKIKNTIAITGEINLQGQVTATVSYTHLTLPTKA